MSPKMCFCNVVHGYQHGEQKVVQGSALELIYLTVTSDKGQL